jgi:cytochrome P450
MEAQIAIAAVVDRFPRVRLATGPARLKWKGGATLRGLEALPLELGSR